MTSEALVHVLLESDVEDWFNETPHKDQLRHVDNHRSVAAYYEIVTAESAERGDVDDRGELENLWDEEDWDPDLDDETMEASVAEALKQAGVSETSSSPFHVGDWYVADLGQDMRTGSYETRSYHLKGFTPEEELAIHELVFPNTYRR